jgi:hypothetical protein
MVAVTAPPVEPLVVYPLEIPRYRNRGVCVPRVDFELGSRILVLQLHQIGVGNFPVGAATPIHPYLETREIKMW